MPGLLADVNVQGRLPYLGRLIDGLGLLDVLAELVPLTGPAVRLTPASRYDALAVFPSKGL